MEYQNCQKCVSNVFKFEVLIFQYVPAKVNTLIIFVVVLLVIFKYCR